MNKINPNWADFFRKSFISNIDLCSDCLAERIIPAFSNINEEADKIEEEAYKKLLSQTSHDYVDEGSLAENARDKAVDYYVMMRDMQQGIINLFTAGLRHLFEQQFLYFHRLGLLDTSERNNQDLFTIKEAKKRLSKHGIEIENFSS